MSILLDTDVTIHVRDANAVIAHRLAGLAQRIAISLVTWIELQAGLATDPEKREQRRIGMARIVQRFDVLKLDEDVVAAYGRIIERMGYSRTRIFDRLIAATAIVHDLTLVTINGADFRDIPGLNLEVWPSPAQ